MLRVSTHFALGDRAVAPDDGTLVVLRIVLAAEPMAVVEKRISAAEYTTAWSSECDAVTDNRLAYTYSVSKRGIQNGM